VHGQGTHPDGRAVVCRCCPGGIGRSGHDELRRQWRIAAGHTPEPTAAVIDSQSVKAAEEVSRASRGYDAGKKVNGRKRHIAEYHGDDALCMDPIGLLLTVLITAAGVQDRDGSVFPTGAAW
jgi:hypothetical protein